MTLLLRKAGSRRVQKDELYIIYFIIGHPHRETLLYLFASPPSSHLLERRARPLQEPAVAPQYLLELVPREVAEARRRVHYGVVDEGRVGDAEALLGRPEGLHEVPVLLGDVDGEVRVLGYDLGKLGPAGAAEGDGGG